MNRCHRCGRELKDPSKVLGPVCERKMEEAHSDMLLKLQDRKCRRCGCTDFTPCPGGCAWVADDLCSACATDEELFAGLKAAKDHHETKHTMGSLP